eukprot:SAG31_NODE_4499_length_3184_cov_13.883955_2_plen_90_part_00
MDTYVDRYCNLVRHCVRLQQLYENTLIEINTTNFSHLGMVYSISIYRVVLNSMGCVYSYKLAPPPYGCTVGTPLSGFCSAIPKTKFIKF